MIEHEGEPGFATMPSRRFHTARRVALRVVLRMGLLLALLASALGGAILATELRPATHVVAARAGVAPKPTVPRPSPTAVPTPAAPARALLGPDGEHATPDGAWLASRTATLRVTLQAGRTDALLRAEAEVVPADMAFTGIPNAASATLHLGIGQSAQAPITVADLVDGQRYHWRVRTHVPGGMTSPWTGGG